MHGGEKINEKIKNKCNLKQNETNTTTTTRIVEEGKLYKVKQ